jgi:uncharacterized protein
MTVVEDDPAGERFVVREGGEEAELRYHRIGESLSLLHTGVPEALEGRGIGGALVRAAVDLAAGERLVLVPYCPFARRWLERHPEVAAAVVIDPP